MMDAANVELLKEKYINDFYDIDQLRRHVVDYFSLHPKASKYVHSVKSRMKDPDHFADKVQRIWRDTDPVTPDNLLNKITDLAGVRVLLLHQHQFTKVKEAIDWRVEKREWFLVEAPKAYTWDPEAENYFKGQGLETHTKPSFYTSVHYLIREYEDSPICCEIQIRTLFEEIWGEVDHSVNYPVKSDIASCRDQIMVLAKLIGAGSRLVDSIFAANKK